MERQCSQIKEMKVTKNKIRIYLKKILSSNPNKTRFLKYIIYKHPIKIGYVESFPAKSPARKLSPIGFWHLSKN